MKSKLEEKPTTDRAVCQEIFDRGSSTEASSPFVRVLKSSKGMSGRRRADGFKPTADIDLGVRLATEMAGGGAQGGGQIPFDDGELLISALDDKPAGRILAHEPADLALKFPQT
jgi:hypothetical protein